MKINKLLASLIGLSIIATLILYPSLPQIIPTHWGINGEVDGSGPKSMAFFTALLPLLLYGLMIIVPKIDPKRTSYQKFEKAYGRFSMILIIFLIGIHWLTMAWSFGYLIPIDFATKMGLGLLIIILGNSLGQIRHNYTMGIKTPWTLASEKVWNKTHRVSSYYFVACGILIMLSSFISGPIGLILSIGSLLIVTLGSVIYSYVLYAQEERNKTQH